MLCANVKYILRDLDACLFTMQYPRITASKRVAAAKLCKPWVSAEAAAIDESNPATYGTIPTGMPSNEVLASAVKDRLLRAEQGSRNVRRRSAQRRSIRLQPGHRTLRQRNGRTPAAGSCAAVSHEQATHARVSARPTAVSFATDVRIFRREVGVHDEVCKLCLSHVCLRCGQ